MESKEEFDALMQQVQHLTLNDADSKQESLGVYVSHTDQTMLSVSVSQYTEDYSESTGGDFTAEEGKVDGPAKKKKKKAKAANKTATTEGPASNLRSRIRDF